MYIFEVPEGEDVYILDADIQAAVASVGAQWPESIMPGTQAVDGRQVVLVYASASKEDIEGLIFTFGLEWLVLASENEAIDPSRLLPFYSDIPVYNEEGELSGSEAVTDLTGKIQTFSGRNWIY